MEHLWRAYGGVLVGWALAVPLAALAAWGLISWRRANGQSTATATRRSLTEIGVVLGTAPWLWMTVLPGAGQQRRANLVPLHDLLTVHPKALPVQVVGNLLVFAVAGLLLPVRFGWFASVVRVMLAAGAGSVAIEAAQYVLNIGRVSSVDDVLLNTIGAGLAAAASRHWWSCRKKWS